MLDLKISKGRQTASSLPPLGDPYQPAPGPAGRVEILQTGSQTRLCCFCPCQNTSGGSDRWAWRNLQRTNLLPTVYFLYGTHLHSTWTLLSATEAPSSSSVLTMDKAEPNYIFGQENFSSNRKQPLPKPESTSCQHHRDCLFWVCFLGQRNNWVSGVPNVWDFFLPPSSPLCPSL